MAMQNDVKDPKNHKTGSMDQRRPSINRDDFLHRAIKKTVQGVRIPLGEDKFKDAIPMPQDLIPLVHDYLKATDVCDAATELAGNCRRSVFYRHPKTGENINCVSYCMKHCDKWIAELFDIKKVPKKFDAFVDIRNQKRNDEIIPYATEEKNWVMKTLNINEIKYTLQITRSKQENNIHEFMNFIFNVKRGGVDFIQKFSRPDGIGFIKERTKMLTMSAANAAKNLCHALTHKDEAHLDGAVREIQLIVTLNSIEDLVVQKFIMLHDDKRLFRSDRFWGISSQFEPRLELVLYKNPENDAEMQKNQDENIHQQYVPLDGLNIGFTGIQNLVGKQLVTGGGRVFMPSRGFSRRRIAGGYSNLNSKHYLNLNSKDYSNLNSKHYSNLNSKHYSMGKFIMERGSSNFHLFCTCK